MRPDFRLANFRTHDGFAQTMTTIMTEEALAFALGMEGKRGVDITREMRGTYVVTTNNEEGVNALPQGTHIVTIYGELALLVTGFGQQALVMAQDPDSFLEALTYTNLRGRPEYIQQFEEQVARIKAESLWVPSEPENLKKPEPKASAKSTIKHGFKLVMQPDGSHEHILVFPDGSEEKVSCRIHQMMEGQNTLLLILLEWMKLGTVMGVNTGKDELLAWIDNAIKTGDGYIGPSGLEKGSED